MTTSRKPVAKGKKTKTADPDAPLTPREEYRAALDNLNNYSYNNETNEAQDARSRLDRAENKLRWWQR